MKFADGRALDALRHGFRPRQLRAVSFSTYCVVCREHSETFSVEELLTGTGNDTGIDAIATIVNSELIDDAQDVENLVTSSKRLDVVFVFVQAKRSATFNGADMSNFFYGVKDFFSDKPKLTRNAEIKKHAEIANSIFSNPAQLLKKPACKLYYVTTGKWVADKDLTGRIESAKADLEALNLFGHIEISPIDADQLHQLYRNTTETIAVEIVFKIAAHCLTLTASRKLMLVHCLQKNI